jgi:hypothetical protein
LGYEQLTQRIREKKEKEIWAVSLKAFQEVTTAVYHKKSHGYKRSCRPVITYTANVDVVFFAATTRLSAADSPLYIARHRNRRMP